GSLPRVARRAEDGGTAQRGCADLDPLLRVTPDHRVVADHRLHADAEARFDELEVPSRVRRTFVAEQILEPLPRGRITRDARGHEHGEGGRVDVKRIAKRVLRGDELRDIHARAIIEPASVHDRLPPQDGLFSEPRGTDEEPSAETPMLEKERRP